MTTVKIQFRGDIRRVTVTDFASLLVHVGTAFKIDDFVIKYYDDDGDRVSIASAEEFDDAIKTATGNKTLKLLIFLPKAQQERKEESSVSGKDDGKDEEEEESKEVVVEEEARPAPVPPRDPFDHGVDCQGCGKRIVGTLFQCTVCCGVSVCADCEEKNVHNTQHTLLKVRVPLNNANKCEKKAEKKWDCKQKWKGCKLQKLRRFALPIIFLAVLRHLPVLLCLLGMWAGLQFMRKKRALLRACGECTHKEDCRVGKKASQLAKGGEKCCGLIPKILFVILCLTLRALPCWCLILCCPFVFCVCRVLRRLKKGVYKNRFRLDGMCGQYRDIFQLNGAQLFQRVQQNTQRNNRGGVPQSVMGCAAVAASESLAASVAAVVALGESVAAELGVNIPVAIPVRQTPYTQQIQVLKEMGFEDTPALQQLLIKHGGNIQAVIADVMQLKSKQQ